MRRASPDVGTRLGLRPSRPSPHESAMPFTRGTVRTCCWIPRRLVCGAAVLGALVGCIGGASAAPAKKSQPPPPEVQAPVRLTQTHTGDLLVSDSELQMILTVDARKLTVLGAFAIPGQPAGVAYLKGGGGRIFVGNQTTKRVEVYDKFGRWQHNLGAADDFTWQPTDIAVDPRREFVFVVDARRRAVKVYSSAGLLLRTIPAVGPDPAQLAAPTGIAVDALHQEVYVSDYGDDDLSIAPRIQVFAYTGELQRTITGRAGMLGRRFARPQGLAVDAARHLFVVECVSGEVLVYDGVTGNGLATLGTYGAGPGQLDFPLDVVLDSGSGDVFVTNNRAGRIELFAEGGVLP